jgi:hypothetical protein
MAIRPSRCVNGVVSVEDSQCCENPEKNTGGNCAWPATPEHPRQAAQSHLCGYILAPMQLVVQGHSIKSMAGDFGQCMMHSFEATPCNVACWLLCTYVLRLIGGTITNGPLFQAIHVCALNRIDVSKVVDVGQLRDGRSVSQSSRPWPLSLSPVTDPSNKPQPSNQRACILCLKWAGRIRLSKV